MTTVQHIWHRNFCLLGIALSFVLFSGSALAQCPRVAVLEGDDAACAQVASALEDLGVIIAQVEGCAHLVANVALDGDSFVLRVSGIEEGEYIRNVGSAQTVAVLIDSLLQSNRLNEHSAEAANTATEKQNATSASMPLAPALDEQTARDHGSHQFRRRFMGMVSAEVARNAYPAIWTGSRLGVCVELAPVCVGIGARFAVFVHPRTASGELPSVGLDSEPVTLQSKLSRHLLDGLLFSMWEVRMGRFSMYSALSIGIQRIWAHIHFDPPPANQEAEPKGRDGAILFGVQLGGAWFLTSQLALDVNLGADIAAPIHGGSRGAGEFLRPPVPIRWARIAIGVRYIFDGTKRKVKP